MVKTTIGALAIAVATCAATPGVAQETTHAGEAVASFAERLRQTDPDAAKKFLALYDAKNRNFDEVKRVQKAVVAATGEEKNRLSQRFRTANKRYIESYLVYLDFLDDVDRKEIARHQGAIDTIKATMDRRRKGHQELEHLLKEQQ